MGINIKITIVIAAILFLGVETSFSQMKNKLWNGKKCAVVLSYDDATNSQLDIVLPLLDSLGLKATFYIPGHSKTLETRLNELRNVAAEGHELENYTIFHPCNGKSRNRNWVFPEYDLDDYNLKKITDEICVQNVLLNAND